MLQPIGARRVTEQAQAHLWAFVSEGNLRPGDRLPPMRELTEQLGVSRTSVREGLRALEALGVVTIRHGSGIYIADGVPPLTKKVTSIDDSARGVRVARELLDVRLAIEPEIAAVAAVRATDEDLAVMARHVAEFRTELGHVEHPASDIQFHIDICRASRNGAFLAIIEWIAQFYANSRKLPEMRDVDDHARIYDAIRRREPEDARAEMTAHLKWIGEVMEKQAGRTAAREA
jgi:GntR family transcriptional repressor for pyruvate dehydrogenase complex